MTKPKMIGIRVSEQQFKQLHARARKRQVSLTDYLVSAGLGELDVKPTDERLAELERRLGKLEKRVAEF